MITFERYRGTRFWAVYEHGHLLCIVVYKKGAVALKNRLESAEPPGDAVVSNILHNQCSLHRQTDRVVMFKSTNAIESDV